MSDVITIDGVNYDTHSGLEMGKASKSSKGSGHSAGKVHAKPQRSHTLNRSFTKRPSVRTSQDVVRVKKPNITRSPRISKFARDPQPMKQQPRVLQDIGPVSHPHVAKAHAARMQDVARPKAAVQTHVPARELKEQAITNALANSTPAKKPKRSFKPKARFVNVATASLAVLLLAGYLTYLNLPALSVRVAAAQAGINASYPDYRPGGYSLNGPVAYTGGEVSMAFKSNSSSQQFTLNQAKSSWDSSALLTNYVDQKSNGNYQTYNDAGLTIYTYGSNAAWVNGGILYTIEGDTQLSDAQVRHIATSM